MVGTVNLNFFEPLNVYHVGCHLSRGIWNKGFATELLNGVILWGGNVKGCRKYTLLW
ncbi:GNAT family N-acetyltransferase [Luteibaculum oceani]|uniref:hypothetical protein n=1 Tax=Luteibaculum oceani TaxID=1294296 RepID=UPI00147729D4